MSQWEEEVIDCPSDSSASSNTSSSSPSVPPPPTASPVPIPIPIPPSVLHERLLVSRHDVPSADPRKSLWYLVDSGWVERWLAWVGLGGGGSGEEEDEGKEGVEYTYYKRVPPGPISNRNLYTSPSCTTLRPSLSPSLSYRGVSPTVYFIFASLHGHDGSPDVPRYTVDIGGEEVKMESRGEAIERGRMTAMVEVRAMRRKFGERGGRDGGRGRDGNGEGGMGGEGEEEGEEEDDDDGYDVRHVRRSPHPRLLLGRGNGGCCGACKEGCCCVSSLPFCCCTSSSSSSEEEEEESYDTGGCTDVLLGWIVRTGMWCGCLGTGDGWRRVFDGRGV